MLDEYLEHTAAIILGWTAIGAGAWIMLLVFRWEYSRRAAVRRLYRLCRVEPLTSAFRPGNRPLQATLTLRRPR